MTQVIDLPTPTAQVSRYPIYPQARAYLRNFLRRGRRAFLRTKRYAYYQHSPSIRVIVIRLIPGIFEVRAYPVDGFCFASLEEALKADEFRAWLFALDDRYRKLYYIAGTQRVGTDLYALIKQALKLRGKLANASHHLPDRL